MESPCCFCDTGLRLTTGIGIAVYPVDGQQRGDLIQVSDFAMHRNKWRRRAPASGVESAPENRRPPDDIIQPWSTTMQPTTPEQTRAEEQFDRAREDAFGNEGAPPARRGGRRAAAGAEPGQDTAAAAVTPASASAGFAVSRGQGGRNDGRKSEAS